MILNFVFSAGPREDRQVYTINSEGRLSDIVGWCKNDGKWKGSQRKIDCYPEKKMGYLSLYKITEHPELIILKIGPKIYFVEKEELKTKFQFKKNQFGYIELKTLDDFFSFRYDEVNSSTLIERIESNVAEF